VTARLRVWVGGLAALAALAAAGAAHAAARTTLTAAIPRDAPPNYLLDDNGRPTGFAVELMALIARRAGVELRYRVEPNWGAVIDALRRGDADIIPDLGVTPERLREFAFSDPVETFRSSVFVRRDTHDVSGIDDLRGRKVAVMRANAAEALLKARGDVRVVTFQDFPDALFALLSGNVDALVYPEPWTWQRARAARVGDRIKVVGGPLIEIKRALAVRADDTELLARLAPAVAAVLASDEYRALYVKWIGTPEPFWTAQRVAAVSALILLAAIVGMGVWRYRTLARVNRTLTAVLADLERRTAEMEGFVYTISHDLKAPLITVGGFARLVEKDVERGDIEQARDSLAEIRKAAHGMEQMIEDLLTLARTGRIVGEAEEVDVGALVAELRSRCAHHIEQEGATVRLVGTPPRLRVDPARFGQVLQNLVENALKYRRPDVAPQVEIGAERRDGELRLYVRDNGRGIPPAYRERIFELFQRLDHEASGTGVGLTIARRIVEVHGGRLWVESEPGRGSTFWIALPGSAVVA
jgi:signal transduction histidine kinase